MVQRSWTHRLQQVWADRPPRKDATCHAAPAWCLDWVHPNRDPAFNPPAKARKHCSAFCSEETGSDLFHNAPSRNPTLARRRSVWGIVPGPYTLNCVCVAHQTSQLWTIEIERLKGRHAHQRLGVSAAW